MLDKTQNILNRLAAADRAFQIETGCVLLLRGVKYVLIGLTVVVWLDLLFNLGSFSRLALTLLITGTVFGLAGYAGHRAFVWKNRRERIARLLESRDPELGSRLINLLQLQEQTGDLTLEPLTRNLAKRAVEDYASGLERVPVEKIARTNAVQLASRGALLSLAIFALILSLFYKITAAEFPRFIDPFGDHPLYSFTILTITDPPPTGTSAIYGKEIMVKVAVSGTQPSELFLTSFPPDHPDQLTTVQMFSEGGLEFKQQLSQIQTDLLAYAHTKDHSSESKKVHIGVILTPLIEQAFISITPPAYTKLKTVEKPFNFKNVEALEGSTVQFRLESNRPLKEGTLELTQGDQAPLNLVLKKSGEKEVTGSFVAKDSGMLRFGVVDVSGLPSQGDHACGLTVTHDLPPSVKLTVPEHDAVVAMDFKLQVQIESSDDYGVTEVRLHSGLNDVFPPAQAIIHDPFLLDCRDTVAMDFVKMGVKPNDILTLFAEAIDNAPSPHLSRSQTVHLKIISVDDYNNFIRERSDIEHTQAKYVELNKKLQDLLDEQKKLGEEAQKLQGEMAAKNANQEALAQKMDQLIAKQSDLNQRLNLQAKRMENFVRDEPIYDIESDLRATLQQEAKDIRDSTQANGDAVKDLAQRSSPTPNSRQISPGLMGDFKKASDDQLAKLGQTEQEEKAQVNQPLQDMSRMQELVKDFNQFEQLYKLQTNLTQQTQAYNRAGNLDREDQLALKDLAATESQVGDDLAELQTKLRADADAAASIFPKAAKSGRNMADDIDESRMPALADQASDQMLSGDGEDSFNSANRLLQAMERLYGNCQGGNCPNQGELDQYLKLKHFNPGNNFSQMSKSKNFGFGKSGKGGKGSGESGGGGFAESEGSDVSVMGNESFSGNSGPSHLSGPNGQGSGTLPLNARGNPGNPDVLSGVNPVNRNSSANSSESSIEEYNDVVDSYFKTITTKTKKEDHK